MLIALDHNKDQDLTKMIVAACVDKVAQEIRAMGFELAERPLSIEEAAEFMKISRSALMSRVRSGLIKMHKQEKTCYFFASELVQSIKARK